MCSNYRTIEEDTLHIRVLSEFCVHIRPDSSLFPASKPFVDTVPITKLFTYRVPFELNDHIDIGYRVVVQFGKKKIITGVVARLHETPPEVYQAKYIIELLDDEPMMNKKQLELFAWISDYYMCTMGEVLNVGMPSGLKLSSESKIQLNPDFDLNQSGSIFSEREQLIITYCT